MRDRLLEDVAAAVRILVLTVDVDDVVIGGGLTALGDELLDGVRAVLARWEAESRVHRLARAAGDASQLRARATSRPPPSAPPSSATPEPTTVRWC